MKTSPRTRWMLRAAATLIGTAILIPAALLTYFTLIEFGPPDSLPLSPLGSAAPPSPVSKLNVVTWNIGYAGLDRDADFFMDGGQMPGPSDKQRVERNLNAIRERLVAIDPDVALLQEVDQPSSRTFDIDQVQSLTSAFPQHQTWYGVNFRAAFVPVPVTAPIGRVESGILTLLRPPARDGVRKQLPGSFSWPTRVFHLKRCAVFNRIPSPHESKDWILINMHLSAFDDGSLRQQQARFLREQMLALHAQGHYVVIGGDWNMVLPGVERASFGPFTTSDENLAWLQSLPDELTPEGWTWAVDTSVPTVRTNDRPYRAGENHRTVIDGFIVSPNVRVERVRGVDLGFEHSDHQPVVATFSVSEQ